MSHISLNNLSIAYGGHKVLQDISVDIPDHQIIAIIGPSGCGKTTLLKSMNRLLDLNEDVKIEGNILIDGLNIYDSEADILALRKKVGFLSQRPYPLPMSIYDNIAFGPRIHRMKGQQVLRQIERLKKITPCWDHFPVLILRLTGLERIPRWTILWNIIFALPVSGTR